MGVYKDASCVWWEEQQGLLQPLVGEQLYSVVLGLGLWLSRHVCHAIAHRTSHNTSNRLPLCAESIVKAARDPSADVKAAAARATGRLLLAQIEAGSGAAPPSLPPLVSTALALLGKWADARLVDFVGLANCTALCGGSSRVDTAISSVCCHHAPRHRPIMSVLCNACVGGLPSCVCPLHPKERWLSNVHLRTGPVLLQAWTRTTQCSARLSLI